MSVANGVTISIVDTQYGPCACSPLGKVVAISEPYAPGNTPIFTTYTYDSSGRALTVTAPDGASVTRYLYHGNQTTVTDPAGKSKPSPPTPSATWSPSPKPIPPRAPSPRHIPTTGSISSSR